MMTPTGNVLKKAATPKAPPPPKVDSKPFKSVDDIKLGMKVRDPATGLVGLASMRSALLSGTVQYAIVPQGDGATVPEGYFVDDFMLEYVDDGVSKRTPPIDDSVTVRLGEKLKDTVTGMVGIATDSTTYLNGCVHFTLTPEVKKGEVKGSHHFDHKRLKKVGEGLVGVLTPKPTKAAPKPEISRSRTGGPMRSAREAALR